MITRSCMYVCVCVWVQKRKTPKNQIKEFHISSIRYETYRIQVKLLHIRHRRKKKKNKWKWWIILFEYILVCPCVWCFRIFNQLKGEKIKRIKRRFQLFSTVDVFRIWLVQALMSICMFCALVFPHVKLVHIMRT